MPKTTKSMVKRHVKKVYKGTIAGKMGSKAKKSPIAARNKALSDVMKSMR